MFASSTATWFLFFRECWTLEDTHFIPFFLWLHLSSCMICTNLRYAPYTEATPYHRKKERRKKLMEKFQFENKLMRHLESIFRCVYHLIFICFENEFGRAKLEKTLPFVLGFSCVVFAYYIEKLIESHSN